MAVTRCRRTSRSTDFPAAVLGRQDPAEPQPGLRRRWTLFTVREDQAHTHRVVGLGSYRNDHVLRGRQRHPGQHAEIGRSIHDDVVVVASDLVELFAQRRVEARLSFAIDLGKIDVARCQAERQAPLGADLLSA